MWSGFIIQAAGVCFNLFLSHHRHQLVPEWNHSDCWQHAESLNWLKKRKRHCQEAHSGQLPLLPMGTTANPLLLSSPLFGPHSHQFKVQPYKQSLFIPLLHPLPPFSISLGCLLFLRLWSDPFRSSILRPPRCQRPAETNCMHQRLWGWILSSTSHPIATKWLMWWLRSDDKWVDNDRTKKLHMKGPNCHRLTLTMTHSFRHW